MCIFRSIDPNQSVNAHELILYQNSLCFSYDRIVSKSSTVTNSKNDFIVSHCTIHVHKVQSTPKLASGFCRLLSNNKFLRHTKNSPFTIDCLKTTIVKSRLLIFASIFLVHDSSTPD